MPRIDLVKKIKVSTSGRARQLEAMFDVPRRTESVVEWHGELPIEQFDWNVGLIVGPSGSGKSSILREIFGEPPEFTWNGDSVIDDFDKKKTMVEIAEACRAVGFNTIPSWLRPYVVLSNGEKFRVDLARRLVELDAVIVDEFTSIVDRQVAQIGSHAVQKFIRAKKRKFIAASCHYDIVDWLQPDWVLEPATMKFARRSLQRRPELQIAICRIPSSAWEIFAPFHYMSADLHPGAQCFGLYVEDRLAAFAATLHRPISHAKKYTPIYGVSRLVTLPDWQGLGLGPILTDQLGAAFKTLRRRLRTYPAHPSLIRSYQKSRHWMLTHLPGAPTRKSHTQHESIGTFGGRPCAVFEYCGPSMDPKQAEQLVLEKRV